MNDPEPQKGRDDLNLDRDYISDLPTDAKERVLMKLPIKDAVRTSILSSEWRNAWASVPNLLFKEYSTQSRLIEKLELCPYSFTYLEVLPVPLYQLKELRIYLRNPEKEELAAAFCLIKNAPNLKVLSLELHEDVIEGRSSHAQNLFKCLEILDIARFGSPEPILEIAKLVIDEQCSCVREAGYKKKGHPQAGAV